MKLKKFHLIECIVFALVALINLWPITCGKFFPTLDGAAHLHNAQLIQSLLFGGSSALQQVYMFTPEVVPNWTGHFLLAGLNSFLPSFVAEKVFLLIYLLGLPYSFRFFVKKVNASNILLSYLIFPFCYTFLFLLGFYNFSLGMLFLFLSLGLWAQIKQSGASLKWFALLALSVFFTYFSHVFVFLFLGIVILLDFVVSFLLSRFQNSTEHKPLGLKTTVALGLSFLIPSVLFLNYYFSRSHLSDGVFLETQVLIDWFKSIRPLVVYNFQIESVYTKKILYALLVLGATGVVIHARDRFFRWKKEAGVFKLFLQPSDIWIITGTLMLIAYFALPDSDATAGFVSVRICLFIFLSVICWMIYHTGPKVVQIFCVLAVLYATHQLNSYYRTSASERTEMAENCYELGQSLPVNSVVLPVNFTGDWLKFHISNYMGTDQPLVLLDNYECDMGYFPLKWNDPQISNYKLGDMNSNDLDHYMWRNNPSNPIEQIEYVLLMGEKLDPNTEDLKILEAIESNYHLIEERSQLKLYKLN